MYTVHYFTVTALLFNLLTIYYEKNFSTLSISSIIVWNTRVFPIVICSLHIG